jgi:ABC-type lipoprotein export system ATPase subunit
VSPGDPCILCEALVKIHKVADVEAVALQGLDLSVARGELMAIIGPSGSGKSSLLNVLGGLDTPSAGKAYVEGIDLVRLAPGDRLLYRRKTVGFVWQNIGRNLIPYLSALENVEMPMILAGTFNRRRARQLLEMVGLERRMTHTPQRMSGGEQQRVAIAIALANEPPVLLADEPTGSLDSENADRVLEVFDQVRRTMGVTVVIVTHDRSLARKVDRYVSIHDGRTSQEAVRKDGPGAIQVGGAVPSSIGQRAGVGPESHEHYLLLDSAGRLRLPREILERKGIRRRVKLVEEEGRIVILPPETKE